MNRNLEFNYRIDDETELRLIEQQDAERLNSLIDRNHAHLKEHSVWLKEDHSIDNTRRFINHNLERFADNEGFAIAIWYKGEMAGQIEYNYIDWANRKTEIGFWLGTSYQGKGLATRSSRFLVSYAFNELKLNRVEMRCAVENKKSRRICENLGFTKEGIVRQAAWFHDHFVDFVIYGMLANDWRE